MHFVCWLWRGRGFWKRTMQYGPGHVRVLASMLQRHGGHRHACITDDSARLAREGSCGRLKTIWPTLSSMLWPTIATGRLYRDHGIDHVIYHHLFGRRVSHHSLRRGRHGTKQLLRALRALGLMRMRFFDSRDLRAKPFWEIVSEAGGRTGVINWWHTWPATPLNGFVVSDRLLYWREVP